MAKRDDLWTTAEAAEYVGMSPRTLERYRVTGEGPKYLKIGRLVYYLQRDLDDWLKTKVRRSTSDPGPEPKPKPKQRPKGRRTRRPPSDPDSEPPNS